MGLKHNDRNSLVTKKKLEEVGRTLPWEKVILGEPASKANRRRLVQHRGKIVSIKSAKALGYANDFARQCQTLDPMFEGDVCVELEIFYASRRPDLDESLILDLLQSRIYRNDRQVRQKIILGGIDRQNPRTHIRVTPMEGSSWTSRS